MAVNAISSGMPRYAAVDGLVSRYAEDVKIACYHAARKAGASLDDADDIAQEAYIKLLTLERAGKIRQRNKQEVIAYANRTAATVTVDFTRRIRNRPLTLLEDVLVRTGLDEDAEPSCLRDERTPEAEVVALSERDRILSYIDTLAPSVKEAFRLAVAYGGTDRRELSLALGITESGAQNRLSRGRLEIARRMRQYLRDTGVTNECFPKFLRQSGTVPDCRSVDVKV